MHFEQGFIYHIFNQGNNHQKIFFERDNYIYFLRKIKDRILPFADILAWCLMPNHFHLMIHVKHVSLPANIEENDQDIAENQSLNSSIGIMLRSYTRAINKRMERTGALFREETKAVCVNCNSGVTKSWFNSQGITKINMSIPEKQYPNILFNYILLNPFKDKLVAKPVDWEFSSLQDFSGTRKGSLINREKIAELGLLFNNDYLDE
jgi:putative transposase